MDKEELILEVLGECYWENIPADTIWRLAGILTVEDIDWLMKQIEDLDLSRLEDDAGDIGDEYWRVTVAISALIISLGKQAMERLSLYESSNHTYIQMALEFIRHDEYLTEYKCDFFE